MPMNSTRHRRAVVMGGWPVATTLPDAAELLGVDLPSVEVAAHQIEPYRHADGSARWSLRRLALELGLEPPRRHRPFKGSIELGR